ncbi:10504_t:CDS:2 [Entrophospora sp. SA101]|nr:10504_t:CDS:2 [Entrophospora sp. SA101]CAJ0837469.1 15212_t:CDS:2 [Entrophospora sp. SA101]
MSTVTFNVGGTKFEIKKELAKSFPDSKLAKLVSNTSSKKEIFIDHNPLAFGVILDYLRHGKLCVPRNVAREVVILQMGDLGIPYQSDNTLEDDAEDTLPSYESALSGYSTVYQNKDSSLKDTVILVALRRMNTLCSDVIIPFLKRHAKRGHHQVTFYLSPNSLTPKNITTELDHINDPHEWIYLPSSPDSNSLDFNKKSEMDDEEDLPDLKFLLQKDNLAKLENFILSKSGVKKIVAKEVEVSCRTENEFGLLFSKYFEIVEIHANKQYDNELNAPTNSPDWTKAGYTGSLANVVNDYEASSEGKVKDNSEEVKKKQNDG